jgi:hypothetical protein
MGYYNKVSATSNHLDQASSAVQDSPPNICSKSGQVSIIVDRTTSQPLCSTMQVLSHINSSQQPSCSHGDNSCGISREWWYQISTQLQLTPSYYILSNATNPFVLNIKLYCTVLYCTSQTDQAHQQSLLHHQLYRAHSVTFQTLTHALLP